MDGIAKAIRDQGSCRKYKKAAVFDKDSEGMAEKASEKSRFGEKCVCIYYLGVILRMRMRCRMFPHYSVRGSEATIKSLLIMNRQGLSQIIIQLTAAPCELGRWLSDTPPYCNEKGGTVH